MSISTIVPAATTVHWKIIKGCDSFTIVVPVLDAAGAAVDVTGWTVKAQVRRSNELLYEWSTVAGNASCAGSSVTLRVIAAQTAVWTWQVAQISVIVTDLASAPHCIATGQIEALPNITAIP